MPVLAEIRSATFVARQPSGIVTSKYTISGPDGELLEDQVVGHARGQRVRTGLELARELGVPCTEPKHQRVVDDAGLGELVGDVGRARPLLHLDLDWHAGRLRILGPQEQPPSRDARGQEQDDHHAEQPPRRRATDPGVSGEPRVRARNGASVIGTLLELCLAVDCVAPAPALLLTEHLLGLLLGHEEVGEIVGERVRAVLARQNIVEQLRLGGRGCGLEAT